MTLTEYLRHGASIPWRDGEHDCSAWPAKWAGIDIPAYSTEAEGKALIESAGGLVPLWEGIIAGQLERTDDPEPGDIGIILVLDAVSGEWCEVGAIFAGKRWAFLSRGGVACVHADPLAVWSLPCRR